MVFQTFLHRPDKICNPSSELWVCPDISAQLGMPDSQAMGDQTGVNDLNLLFNRLNQVSLHT